MVPVYEGHRHLSMNYHPMSFHDLLTTGSEERRVLGLGSIPVAIVPYQYMKLLHHTCLDMSIIDRLGGKNKKHPRCSIQATIHPLAIILSAALRASVSITAYIYCTPYNPYSVSQ